MSTGEAARLEATFTDNTRLTLGEKAKLTLDTYVFDPAAGSGTIKFGVVGPLRFLSGQVSKLASADVSVTTAVATLGIRGTEFWGGPIDDQALGVFLIEGVLSVSNATGEQILRAPSDARYRTLPCRPGTKAAWRRMAASALVEATYGQRPGRSHQHSEPEKCSWPSPSRS